MVTVVVSVPEGTTIDCPDCRAILTSKDSVGSGIASFLILTGNETEDCPLGIVTVAGIGPKSPIK